MSRRQNFKMGTWLDPEEYAYPSGKLRDSRRKFRAIMNAGTANDFVNGIAGIPDTFFSIPARGTFHGEEVRGYISVGGHWGTGEGVLIFNIPRIPPDEEEDDEDDDGYEENKPAKMPQAFYYNDAAELYDHHPRGKIGPNTTIRRDDDGSYAVRLYDTDIITYHPDDSITLNSGGHRTATTKGRINSILGPRFNVYSERGQWYVRRGSVIHSFYDGIRITPEGTRGASYMGNPKSRQVNFKQTGGTAYGKAQRVAFNLRSAGHEAEQESIPSPAGSWADSIYIMTNAPLPVVRKMADAEGLEVIRNS